ncbi:MAG: hypothetical protein HC877_17160 [Thioploca sp.]|nr:hypothetical protein [Thioploca sp.]
MAKNFALFLVREVDNFLKYITFNQFENIEPVIKKYPLKIQQTKFLPAVEEPLPSAFIEDIHFLLTRQQFILPRLKTTTISF